MLNLLASDLTARFNVSRADCLGTWVVALALLLVLPTVAEAQSRKLSMYYTHTKESLTVTYKKNGKYVPSALKKLDCNFVDL